MRYNINGNKLKLDKGISIFEHEIDKLLEFNDLLVIMLKNYKSNKNIDQPLNNVYAVNENGETLWNIKDIIGKDSKYDLMRLDEHNNLFLNDFLGIRYTIDIQNKKVISAKGFK